MSGQGLTAKGPPQGPPIQGYLRIAIVALSVICLVCAAVSLGLFPLGFGAPGFMIFVVLKCLIIHGVFWFIEAKAQHVYYRLAALIAYCYCIIFWLSAWAWAASWAAAYCWGGVCWDDGAMAACAAFGAVNWVVSCVHLFFFIRSCLRDAPAQNGPGVSTYNNAELGKVPQPMPQQSYPAAQYPQQPYTQ